MMTADDSITIKICGPAGSGIMKLGELLSSALNQCGFFTLTYPEYPSAIRGGDNNVQIVISSQENLSPRNKIDLLFALDQKLLDSHREDLKKDALVFDANTLKIGELPEVAANPIVKNTVAAGFIWKVLSQDLDTLLRAIKETIDEKYVDINFRAVELGYELQVDEKIKMPASDAKKKINGATANEILSLAIKKADCQYCSIYPITPINSLLGFLSQTDIKMVVPEDEIFAALSTIGASYAGKRSVTATSGAGFSLMCEAVGFSSMAEIPLVVVLGQRSGPSSGMPTYSGQSDLNLAINPGHGDFPKIVLAPGDLQEAMNLGQTAFNLAEKYQLPVIVLADKYMCESRFSSGKGLDEKTIEIDHGKRFEAGSDYCRYKLSHDGISPRAYPGETTFLTSSYEHDECGFSADDAKTRTEMMDKRDRKIENMDGGFEVFGNKNSDTLIVGWGSTKSSILEYLAINPEVKYIHIWRPWPFAADLKKEVLKAKKVIVIENNFSGQMASLIEMKTLKPVLRITKDDGRPFYKEELAKLIDQSI